MTKRAYIFADQISDLFHRRTQSRHESLTVLVDNAFRDLEALEGKRRELKPKAFEEKRTALRDEHIEKCQKTMDEIRELWADAEAQLQFSYDPANLRERQAFELPPVESAALQAELSRATPLWLVRRAQRAHAEDDVATAVYIDEELARRAETGNPPDSVIRNQIREATSATSNDALCADMAARLLLLKTTHMAEAAKLKHGTLTGETRAIDKIKYGVRVHQDLVARATPTRTADLRSSMALAEEEQRQEQERSEA